MIAGLSRVRYARNYGDPWRPSNRALNAVYTHIPKNAGRSVEAALFGHTVGHIRLVAYQWHDRAAFRRAFKFTFVRNPWDRAVSAFHFLKRGGLNSGDAAWAAGHLQGIDTFADFVARLRDERFRRAALAQWHFHPQHIYLEDLRGRLGADFIGRFERLEEGFARVCERLGVEAALPRLNASARREDYRSYYAHGGVALIGQIYRRDVERFGYCF